MTQARTTVVMVGALWAGLAGFNDSHVHFLSGGQSLGDVDLAGLTTLLQVQNAIRDFAAANTDTPWVKGRGGLYSPFPAGSPSRA